MTLTNHEQAPSADECMEIAERYMRIGYEVAADDRDATHKALEEYFTDDPIVSSKRLWFFGSVGPVIVAAGIKKLNQDAPPLGPDDLWVIEDLDPGRHRDDPDELAAAQSVIQVLNGDRKAMQDVVSAHFDAAYKHGGTEIAHDAMFGMVVHHLHMLAALIKEGAFGALPY